ncbi:hypothetical protein KY362_05345 [Candidatus Woesearchaeota archaeon]|nr:hypothetical protein [Candidatus Woesearchaeota archaeon]
MALEVTIVEIENDVGTKYKVTRRDPELAIAETKIFRSLQDAKMQLDTWLQ